MIRKMLTALFLVPLTIVLVLFAVTNRHAVVVSFDPFDPSNPALAISLPLFLLILFLVLAGVAIGGTAAWLRQSKWRLRARRFEAEARRVGAENKRLRNDLAHSDRRNPPLPAVE